MLKRLVAENKRRGKEADQLADQSRVYWSQPEARCFRGYAGTCL